MNDLLKLILDNKGKIGIGTYRAILLAGVLWLNSSFVSKTDYISDKKAQSAINEKVSATLVNVNNTLLLMASQDALLKDHEARLRALEARR